MKLLILGGTGFTGSVLIPSLLHHGWGVRCLARLTSDRSHVTDPRVEWLIGDVTDTESLERAMDDVQGLISLISLGTGHAPGLVAAAQRTRLARAVFFSTTAIFTRLNPSSKAIRLAAEAAILQSGLPYTILRPTMIFGGARDRNMARLVRYLQHWPVVPIFGRGTALQQPVYVADLAQAVVQCLSAPRAVGQAYNLPGAEPLSYNQVIDTICSILGRRTLKIHLPSAPFVAALGLSERLGIRFLIRSEQLLRLNEDKAFSYAAAHADFGYTPRSFAQGIAQEIADLALPGQDAESRRDARE